LKDSTFTHLDEYMDVLPHSVGSMAHELKEVFFGPLGAEAPKLIPVLSDGRDPVLAHEESIKALGRLDLQLLGIGHNGHIAFNEPGAPFGKLSHINALTERTLAANSERFPGKIPTHALTLGIAGILRAKSILLLATGTAKAEAVADMLLGPISPDCPASAIRLHDHALVVLDQAAASKLLKLGLPNPERPEFRLVEDPIASPRSVLVVSPHPDDASISCGGLLASLQSDIRKVILTMTTGSRAQVKGLSDPEAVATLREQEVLAESATLGCEARFLRGRFYESGTLEQEDVSATVANLRELKPSIILVTSRLDAHPTHRMTRIVLDEALNIYLGDRDAPDTTEVWTYEGPWHQLTAGEVNLLVRFRPEHEALKVRAMLAHRSQMERVPYHEGAKALARLRAISLSESHLGGAVPGNFDELPLIEAYVREIWRRRS
jgi:6-phosphogluconolactonase/glucosamine-6-phosphate isomerase/deaminase/LmbE family N-acetylglucosaminyl deacetylase